MKVTPNTKQVLTGSITATELAAFVRQTLEIPEGAKIKFARETADDEWEVTDDQPLAFSVEWTGKETAEQTVPTRAYTTVKLP